MIVANPKHSSPSPVFMTVPTSCCGAQMIPTNVSQAGPHLLQDEVSELRGVERLTIKERGQQRLDAVKVALCRFEKLKVYVNELTTGILLAGCLVVRDLHQYV